jgi:hypothetical protein
MPSRSVQLMSLVRRRYMSDEEFRHRLFAFVICVIGTLVLPLVILHQFGRFAPTDDPSWSGDHLYYFAMSQHSVGASALVPIENKYLPYAPFSYRLLTPLIASLLPIDQHLAFLAITLIAFILTSFVFYLFLRQREYSHTLGLLGVGLFLTLYPAAGFVVLDNYLPEPLTFLVVLLAFITIEQRKDWLFLAIVSIGVLNKETVLFLLPVYYVFTIRREGRLNWARALVIGIVPVSIWLLPHIFIHPTNNYSYLNELLAQLQVRLGNGPGGLRHQVAQYSFLTWGPLLFLVLSLPRRSIHWLMKEEHLALWVALAYLQTLVASDIPRLLVYAFPVVIPLALGNLRYLAQIISTPVAVLGTAVILGQILYFHPFVFGSSLYLVLIWLVLAAMVWWWRKSSSSNTTEGEGVLSQVEKTRVG